MSDTDADDLHDNALRRTQSTGDIPRRPERIHKPRPLTQAFRYSESHSDACDQHPAPEPTTLATTAIAGPSTTGRISPPISFSLLPSDAQSQTIGGQNRPHRTIVPPLQPPRDSWYRRTMTFLGVGRGASRERRTIVGLFVNLFSAFVQIVIISVILGLAGTRFKSPTQPDLTEWVACNRPLGIWACIWVVRAVLASALTYWGFVRERKIRHRHQEDGVPGTSNPSAMNSPRTGNTPTNVSHPTDHVRSSTRSPSRALPYTLLYSRLTLLSSLLTLSWFLTAHILEYTSINTCRHSSPHIWWLTFGILCLMYISVLEVVLLSFVVFIIAPILFLFWNIVLICVGRHPLQTNSMIRPEIGKLPKSLVDSIPLVIYIPPPPDGPLKETLAIPKPVYSYPPNPTSASTPKTRFRFIRKLSSFKGKQNASAANTSGNTEDPEKNTEPQTWEQHWEQGEYPFVVLEGNRAACAICLMDFEEPKKIGGVPSDIIDTSDGEKTLAPEPLISEIPSESATPRDDGDDLKLADAGEGAQPLRLLACGHVFHKTCLDPWLIDVSGRCPVCQRAVELPDPKKNRKERR